MPEKQNGGSAGSFEDPKSHAHTIHHQVQSDIESNANDATTLADASATVDIVEGYQIISTLGEGGMGVVYRATQRSLSRDVALKLMKDMGDDESFVARFRREAITGARLNHPNIVAVYDHGHIEGNVYLVLEYIKGSNCAELIDASGRMAVRLATEIIRGCVLGLSHAEQLGVIHRDIKPANIMIVEDDTSDARGSREVQPKIADFGLARLHDGNDPDHVDLTQAGSVMGTPGYMAPEQALGKEVDFRADIYSLGSTFYCLLTGTKPFHGSSMIEVLHKKLNDTAPSPQDLVDDIPDSVIVVLDRMMAKSRDDRYQSYENLLSDLDSIIKGEKPQTVALSELASSLNVGGKDTRRNLMLRPGDMRRNLSNSNGRKALFVVLAVLIVAVVWAVMQPDDGGAKSADTIAAVETKIRDWSAKPAIASFGAFESLCTEIDKDLNAIEDETVRKQLTTTFKESLASKLSSNEALLLNPLESIWKRRSWQELSTQCAAVKTRYERAELAIPDRLSQFARFASLALNGDVSLKENNEATFLETASMNPETLSRMKAFVKSYQFSPVHEWAKNEVSRLTDVIASSDRSAAFDSLVVDLESKKGQDFLRSWAENHGTWRAQINALPQDQMTAAKTKLDALIGRKKTETVADLKKRLEVLWHGHHYDELSRLLAESDGQLTKVGEPLSVEWEAYRVIAIASKGSIGLGEKMAWEALQGEKDDLVYRIAMLQSYLEKFGKFAPTAKAAREELAMAVKQAPLFEIEVSPKNAVIRLNKIKLAKSELSTHRLLGVYEIEAAATGFYDLKRTIKHPLGGSKLNLSMAKRSSRNISVQLEQSSCIPLTINPLNTKKPAFPLPRGLSVEVVPREAGLVVGAHNMKTELWRLTTREIFVGRIAKILFPDEKARYWQLHGRIENKVGETEVRILKGANGSHAVVGLRPRADGSCESYFGVRSGDGTLQASFTDVVKDNGRAIRFSLSWFGDVCVFGLCDELEDDPKKARVVASVTLDYTPTTPNASISLAVNRGSALFANLELYPMK